MSVNEVLLIILLKNIETKQQQALVLQKYVLRYKQAVLACKSVISHYTEWKDEAEE